MKDDTCKRLMLEDIVGEANLRIIGIGGWKALHWHMPLLTMEARRKTAHVVTTEQVAAGTGNVRVAAETPA